MYLLVVNYHYISNAQFPHPGIYPVTPSGFERQLDALAVHFEFVSLRDLLSHLDGERALPEYSCLVTFDDGLREQIDNAWPILVRKGIPAAFFVNTAFTQTGKLESVHQVHWLRAHVDSNELSESILATCRKREIQLAGKLPDAAVLAQQYRYDTPEVRGLKYLLNFQLSPADRGDVIDDCFQHFFSNERQVAADMYMTPGHWRMLSEHDCLGTHAHRHVPLAELTHDEVANDLQTSMKILESHTGKTPLAVSYPYGGPTAVSADVVECASQLGLRLGFTMERAFNRTLDHPLLLGRADTNDAIGGKSPAFHFSRVNITCTERFGSSRCRWVNDEQVVAAPAQPIFEGAS